MSLLHIDALAVEMIIGIHPHEREAPQMVYIDLDILIDSAQVAKHNDITQALNYEHVVTDVKQLAATPFDLIETFAEMIYQLLLKKYALEALRVTVKKPQAIAQANYVSITVGAIT